MRHLHPILILVCMLGITASCKRSPAPPPPKPAADTLVICIGGLGRDRTVIMEAAIRDRCPRAIVVSAASWDAYKVDIRPIITANPTAHRVYLLHSYAAWWLSVPLPVADYVATLDGVDPGNGTGLTWWGDLPYPAFAKRFDCYWRTATIGPRVARIVGATPIMISGGHNDVPEDAGVIDRTVTIINAF